MHGDENVIQNRFRRYLHQQTATDGVQRPGTTEEVLIPILEESNGCGLKAARDATANGEDKFLVAFSPEREDPGNDSIARRDIPKVVGGLNSQASELAATLYGAIFNRVVPVRSCLHPTRIDCERNSGSTSPDCTPSNTPSHSQVWDNGCGCEVMMKLLVT